MEPSDQFDGSIDAIDTISIRHDVTDNALQRTAWEEDISDGTSTSGST